jgi:hypothetical protein
MKLNSKSLDEVKLGNPIIAPGIYFGRIEKADLKENNAKTGWNLNIQFKLAGEELPANAGGMVKNNGMSLFRTVSLVPTDKYDPDKVIKEVSVAVGHLSEDTEPSDLIGKSCKVRVKYVAAEGQYDEKNEIAGFLPIKESDGFNG